MWEEKLMTVQDFMEVMRPNEGFYPEYACLSEKEKECLPKLNLSTGFAQSHYLDGKLVAVSGIRCLGVGEAWFITIPEMREKLSMQKLMLKHSKEMLIKMRDSLNLWCLFATNRISANYLEHLDFMPEPRFFVWVRTE
jgi:hypothetical protein